ncbi:peptide-O-fucosyltransferase [Sarracenia purpurea var. burkii]
MFFVALLNRVLVIPSPKVDFQFDRVIDMDHVNKYLERKVVVAFGEFVEAKKNHLHIDKFLRYFPLPQPCFIDDEHVKELRSLGISMNKVEAAWFEDVKKPTKRARQDPGGPLAHKRMALIEPNRLTLLTAQRCIQTFFGREIYCSLFPPPWLLGVLSC